MARPDFPDSLIAFQARFGQEQACFEFLRDSRWPDGFSCPECMHAVGYPRADRWGLECGRCGRVTSVTAGSVMHKSHVDLRRWLLAAWLVITSKRGISALELKGQIDVSYETAYTMLHRLRVAMVAPQRTLLRGRVEVDESYVGGPEPGARGRGAQGKALVIGGIEARENGPGRIRLRMIGRVDAINLHRFVRENVEEGSTLVTDGNATYGGLYGFKHVEQVVGRDGLQPADVLPYFHTAMGNLKTWLLGTHHGAVRAKHLQAYLDEFTFRFNRRGNLQAAFQTLLGLAPKVGRLSYGELYGDTSAHRLRRKRKA